MESADAVEPTFDKWGLALGAQAAPRGSRLARALRPTAAWWGIAAVAVLCALAGALVVHLSAGDSAAAVAASHRDVARAINLQPTDLPGFTIDQSHDVSAAGDPATAFKSCFGRMPSALSGGARSFDSPQFQQAGPTGTVAFGSSVGFPSAPTFAAERGLAADPRFPRCFARALGAIEYTAHGTRIHTTNARATAIRFPVGVVAAGHKVLAMRLTFDLSANGIDVPTYLDLYAMRVGHDEVDMYALSTATAPPGETEARVLALLDVRAQAQPH